MARVAKTSNRDSTGGASRPRKIPRASELPDAASATMMALTPPTPEVLHKLGKHQIVVGVDIETADWETGSTSLHKGAFGFFNLCRPEVFVQRVVQLGWAIGDLDESSALHEYKEITIRPSGFEISTKAANLHGVTQSHALEVGVPLREALIEFMEAMQRANAAGGRVVIHHLEFDAGILARELSNAGLENYVPIWREIAQQGFCTMDPEVCRWAQVCHGRVFQEHESDNIMTLGKLLKLLLPNNETVKELVSSKRLHTAGGDSQAHRLVYVALRRLADKAAAP